MTSLPSIPLEEQMQKDPPFITASSTPLNENKDSISSSIGYWLTPTTWCTECKRTNSSSCPHLIVISPKWDKEDAKRWIQMRHKHEVCEECEQKKQTSCSHLSRVQQKMGKDG